MGKHKIAAFAVCLAMCLIVLTGCWDKIEIEDRLFVLAMGIDKVPEEKKLKPTDKIDIYFVSPIVAEATKGGKGNAFNTYDSTGESLTDTTRDLLTRFHKNQFYGHCDVMIFGEELVKDSGLFKQVLDFLGRSHELHDSMDVFVTPGKAADVFKIQPMYDRLLAPYISGIANNSIYAASIRKTTLAELLTDMEASDGNALLPLLTPYKDEVQLDRLAIIKNYKLLGYVNHDEARAVNWLTDKAKGGVINFDFNGLSSTYRYSTFKRTINLDKVADGKIYLTYNMDTEGAVEGYSIGDTLLTDKLMRDLEKAVENEIKAECESTIKKFQQEYRLDLIGAQDYLRKYQPRLYKDIERNYESFFADKIVINIYVDAKVRRVGMLK